MQARRLHCPCHDPAQPPVDDILLIATYPKLHETLKLWIADAPISYASSLNG
ncbi:MAG: hypothetical protein AAF665_09115 [Pseudomonadota bacterium]